MGCCSSSEESTRKERPLTEEEKDRLEFVKWFRDTQCSVTQPFETPEAQISTVNTVESCLEAECAELSKALYGQTIVSVGVVSVARKLPEGKSSLEANPNPLAPTNQDEVEEGNSPRPQEDEEREEKPILIGHKSVQHHHNDLRDTRNTLISGSIYHSCLGEDLKLTPDKMTIKALETEDLVQSMVAAAMVTAQASNRGVLQGETVMVALPPWNFLSFEEKSPVTSNDSEEEGRTRCQLSLVKLVSSRHDGDCLFSATPRSWGDGEDKFEVLAEYLAVESQTTPGIVVGGMGLIPSTRWSNRLTPCATRIAGNVLK